jgi:hypothetical protein
MAEKITMCRSQEQTCTSQCSKYGYRILLAIKTLRTHITKLQKLTNSVNNFILLNAHILPLETVNSGYIKLKLCSKNSTRATQDDIILSKCRFSKISKSCHSWNGRKESKVPILKN